ncbi:ribonuclease HII [Candidatus Micrarchaeota archaeon]|nr:ribonuclease HII [Candidatus Micrarchaeota archaeon]
MLICGVDEAGRGPVLGPMVICLASIEEGKRGKLIDLGVSDSKKLTPAKREELYPRIMELCECRVRSISAAELNDRMGRESLNLIEAREMGKLSDGIEGRFYIDLPEKDPSKFLRKAGLLGKDVIAEHKADARYPIVGAASIIAKVTRDREICGLKEACGEIGSGYPSDEKTISALRDPAMRKKLEGHIRVRWGTMERILNPTLLDF